MLRCISREMVAMLGGCLLAALAFSAGHFESPDAHLRLHQSFSLIEQGTFAIQDGVGNLAHGNIAVNADGVRYSVYNPGQIVLFTPIASVAAALTSEGGIHPHFIAEIFASFVGPAIHFLTALVVYVGLLSIGVNRWRAQIAVLLFAFGTFNLPSARDGFGHTYEAFFVCVSFLFAVKSKKLIDRQVFYAAMAGLCLGLGCLFRSTSLLALPGLLILLSGLPRIRAALAGLGPFLVLVGLYNRHRFGSMFENGYDQAWAAADAITGIGTGFSISSLPLNGAALWLSPGKGMLIYSPILLAVLWGVADSYRRNTRLTLGVLTTVVLYTALYGSNFAWHGSAWCWGPRYLVPLSPLLFLLVSLENRQTRMAFFGLGALSCLIQLGAVLCNYKRHLLNIFGTDAAVLKDGRIFFDWSWSPVVSLPTNVRHVLNRVVDGDTLHLFLPQDGWKSEARDVTWAEMMQNSVDLNSIDLWWVRVLYYPWSTEVRLALMSAGLGALVWLVWCVYGLLGRNEECPEA